MIVSWFKFLGNLYIKIGKNFYYNFYWILYLNFLMVFEKRIYFWKSRFLLLEIRVEVKWMSFYCNY